MTLGFVSMDLLWQNALGVIPLAIAVGLICRFVRCRASTRHALWLIVLLSLMAPPLLPALNMSDDLGSPRFFASLRDQRDATRQAAPSASSSFVDSSIPANPRGEARFHGTLAPPAILSTSPTPAAAPASVPPSVLSNSPGSRVQSSSSAAAPCSAPPSAVVDGSSPDCSTPAPAPAVACEDEPCVAAVPSAQLPASSSDGLTASERSPTPLRMSASHPNSSKSLESSSVSSALDLPACISQPGAVDAAIPPVTGVVLSAEPKPDFMKVAIGYIAAAIDSIEWRDWLLRLAAARDAIVSLAPIPTSLWLAGCVVLLSIMLIRIARFRRVLRNSWPTSNDVLDVVGDCAAAVSLSRLPEVLITDARVSPLVWCGLRRRTLVIPASLWDELDDTARRAVLLHELAHVRRRDHWVCWIEMIACTVYWWNPVAWWVRNRLRDEADYCCDAWVTAVLPSGGARSAYARALLTTKQYLNASRLHAPSLALGATSARTKRFARRLTMVMTERTAPRLSLTGSALALLLAAGTWLATPLWACPPEESSGPSAAAAVAAQKAEKASKAAVEKAIKAAQKAGTVVVPHEVIAHQAPADVVVVAPGQGSTFEQHMAARDQAPVAVAQASPRSPRVMALGGGSGQSGGGDAGLEQRIDRLEQRMDRLTAALEQLLGGGGTGVATTAAPSAPAATARPRGAMAPAMPAPPAAPATPRAPGGGFNRAAPGGGGAFAPAGADDGETIIRFYELPDDKAQALFEFMRRDDVPVLVASRDGGIEVHGTARQHEIFAMFIRLISPDSRLDSMSPMNERAAEELAAAAGAARRSSDDRSRQVREEVARAREQIQRTRQTQGEQVRKQMEQQRKELEKQRKSMQEQRQQMQKRTQEMLQKSRDLNTKASELERKADAMDDGDEKTQLEAKAAALEAQAEELEAQADAQEDELEARLEAMEAEFEAQQEAMEAQLEAQQEAMEAEMEARMAALEAEAEAAEAAANPR